METVVFAQEGEDKSQGDGKSSKKGGKRRRVRKDQAKPQERSAATESKGSSGAAAGSSSDVDGGGDSPLGVSFLELAQEEMFKTQDERIKKRAKSAIERDLGGGLMLEEFATAEEIMFDEDVDPLRVMPVNDFELPIPSETGATPLADAIDTKAAMTGAIDLVNSKEMPDFKKQFASTLPSIKDLAKKEALDPSAQLRKQQQKAEEAAQAAKALEPITDYSLGSAVLGESRPIIGIELPFLQSGHLVVLGFSLLCAFIEYPGLPFTELPDAYRQFFQQGLVIVYLINTGLAYLSIGAAKKRDQNAFFWALKVFLLGGLAFQELNLIAEKKRGSV